MKFLYTFLFSLIVLLSQANQSPTLFSQLQSINACWSEQKDIGTLPIYGIPQNYTDKQLIQLHLQLVETTLRNRTTNGLSEAQKTARLNHLNNLHIYWQTNTYPINNKTANRNPVFIDDYNTFCAVGYLIKTSGHERLARNIAATQNLSYLRDIRIEGLNQWVMESGLTLDELAWIQPGYLARIYARSLGKGVNGPVYALAGDEINKIVYTAGSFTMADSSLSCNNIVAVHYDENDLFHNTFNTLGEGLNGTIYALYKDDNQLYAGGHFDHSGATAVNNIAKWNGTSWQAMGQLNGTVYAITTYNNNLYAGGNFTFEKNGQTYNNIAYWDGTSWNPICGELNGEVKALAPYNNTLAVGGAFTLLDTNTMNHIFAYDGTNIISLHNGVTATVRALEAFGPQLYAGGDLKQNDMDTNSFGFKVYNFADGWSGLNIDDSTAPYQAYIQTINSISNFYLGGKLLSGGMYYSYNTGHYNEHGVGAFASPNNEVFSILSLGQNVFFGGIFDRIYQGTPNDAGWSYPASNLAIWDPDYVGIRNAEPLSQGFTISPNPSSGNTLIESATPIKTIHVYDISGKLIWENTPEKDFTKLNLERAIFPSGGLYMITLETTNGGIQNRKLLVD